LHHEVNMPVFTEWFACFSEPRRAGRYILKESDGYLQMLFTDKLAYLELQKTGGSHVRVLLQQLFGAKVSGKHNRPDSEDLEGKLVIGSIRNPWDWYVSLWAYGVGGKGALRYRTTHGPELDYYRNILPRSMGKKRLSPHEFISAFFHDLGKPANRWAASYALVDDPSLFRQWLKMVFDPVRRFDLGEGFAFSPLSRYAGLLTFRYYRLFTLGDTIFTGRRLSEFAALETFDHEYNIAAGMIRTEHLEDDLIGLLNRAGYSLDEAQIDAIRHPGNGRTNTSRRRDSVYYYDEETLNLVGERDRFLIEKYAYSPPEI